MPLEPAAPRWRAHFRVAKSLPRAHVGLAELSGIYSAFSQAEADWLAPGQAREAHDTALPRQVSLASVSMGHKVKILLSSEKSPELIVWLGSQMSLSNKLISPRKSRVTAKPWRLHSTSTKSLTS